MQMNYKFLSYFLEKSWIYFSVVVSDSFNEAYSDSYIYFS